MMNRDTLDLNHKKRKVYDLVRFIKNTSAQSDTIGTPNFSLLLGAGVSISSGIKSGGQLVTEWKHEIFEEEKDNPSQTEEEYFINAKSVWFDENNAYSSLFEHRYDLQRQRRIFVENQVAGKVPSIGYAYLVSLIDKGYFNTIFTTNFDDLLNEAFYRFSSNRPIVCAHDSSISGITVTSERPKIIKLHGDYLFDNIKTTLRETESLEQNMRQKFQEFAKDFGLIVVGYSGRDRSIMDILNFLLQHDEYFKNGVYWCLLPGEIENISGELKNLLWKERVYLVEIDGFDEFMAELNYKLTGGELPINDEFMTRRHQERIIKELTENKNITDTKSEILHKDCISIKQKYTEGNIKDLLRIAEENSSSGNRKSKSSADPTKKMAQQPMTEAESRIVKELQDDLFLFRKRMQIKQKLQQMNILQLLDGQYKVELAEMYAHTIQRGDDAQIKIYYDELIRLNPNIQKYYIIASDKSSDLAQKTSYMQRALDTFSNDYYIYNEYACLLLNHLDELLLVDETNEQLQKVEKLIRQSIKLNPAITNPAYRYHVGYYELLYKNRKNELKEYLQDLYTKLSQISVYHPATLFVANKAHIHDYNEEKIRQSIDFYLQADNPKYLEECYLALIDYKLDKEDIGSVLPVYAEYEKFYNPSEKYMWHKAQVLQRYEYFDDVLKIFDSISTTTELQISKIEILNFLDKAEELDTYYQTVSENEEVRLAYLQQKGRFQEALSLFQDKMFDSKSAITEQLVMYSYLLLKNAQYAKVEQLLKPYYDNPLTASASIIINYLFARQQQGKNVADKVREKILDNKYIDYEPLEIAAAHAVIKQKSEMLKSLKKAFSKSPIQKYNVRTWPIMAQYINDEDFKKVIAPSKNILQ